MHHIKAAVKKPNGKLKSGKGFSVNELKAAGVSRQQAKQAKLPVDMRRKSQHDENVKTIKAHVKKA